MTNAYYNSPVDVAAGVKVRSVDTNAVDSATDAAFDKLPTEANLKRGTINYAVTGGSVNAYTVTLPHTPSGLVDGLLVSAYFHIPNTLPSTINVNGLGAVAIKLMNGNDPAAGDLQRFGDLRYSILSGFFHVQANSAVASASASASASAALASKNAAGVSESNAADSADTATTQAGLAEDAKDAAEVALGDTITARDITTAARDVTTAARDVTTAARDVAVAAKDVAVAAADSASDDAGTATAAAGTATTAANAAAASLDSFDDRYLGAKTADPTLDNDGGALITGALYFNSVAGEMRVYSGSAWAAAYLPATGYATLNGTETLANKTLPDATTTFADDADNTKKMRFQLSGITAGQTRTLTVPDADGPLINTAPGTAGNVLTSTGTGWASTAPASTSGDAATTSSGSSVTLTASSARVQVVSMTASGLQLNLPAATTLSRGGPTFIIRNGGNFTFAVKDAAGNTLAILGSGQIIALSLSDISTSAGVWLIGNENADGTALQAMAAGAVTAITSNAISATAARAPSCCGLSSSKFVVTYVDTSVSEVRAVVVDVAITTITIGTPVTVISGQVTHSVCTLTATKAVVAYANGSGFGTARTIDVSGSTITLGTAFQFDANNEALLRIQALTTTTAIVLYADTSNNLTAKVLTVSGITITGGAAAVLQSATATAYQALLVLSAIKAVALYQLGSSTFLTGAVLDISGTTITPGSNTALNAVASTEVGGAALNGTQFVAAILNAGANGSAYLVTVSGTSFAVGSSVTFRSGALSLLSAAPVNGRRIALAYCAPTTNLIETNLLTVGPGEIVPSVG
ncbi:MAG TPA: hypothetical protein VIT92_07150, partial [Burkholderiaceae bacterium]